MQQNIQWERYPKKEQFLQNICKSSPSWVNQVNQNQTQHILHGNNYYVSYDMTLRLVVSSCLRLRNFDNAAILSWCNLVILFSFHSNVHFTTTNHLTEVTKVIKEMHTATVYCKFAANSCLVNTKPLLSWPFSSSQTLLFCYWLLWEVILVSLPALQYFLRHGGFFMVWGLYVTLHLNCIFHLSHGGLEIKQEKLGCKREIGRNWFSNTVVPLDSN